MSTEQKYIATKLADEVIKKYMHMQLQNFLFHIPTKSIVLEGVHAYTYTCKIDSFAYIPASKLWNCYKSMRLFILNLCVNFLVITLLLLLQ